MRLTRLQLSTARVTCFVQFATFQPGILQAQYQWWCHYPNLGYAPYDGRAWEGYHNVKYVSYIPADHIDGPTTCRFPPLSEFPIAQPSLKYKGDPGAILYVWISAAILANKFVLHI